MYKRDYVGFAQPPMLKSPASTSSALDSSRNYRWTSGSTSANNSRFAETPRKSPPKKPDMSWMSPSRGDTWRLHARSGRTRDLVAAFNQCALHDRHEQYEPPKYMNVGRFRRNSEPAQENEEREVVTTNFIDDSMIQGDHDEYEEHDVDLEQIELDLYPKSSRSPKKNTANVSGFVTSTPQIQKEKSPEPSTYFNHETSITQTPVSRRDRRRTQTIRAPSFDSPASERKFKAPLAPPPPVPHKSRYQSSSSASPSSFVKSITSEFEKADFGFHRKIDPALEIAELRKQAVEVNVSKSSTFDENRNVVESVEASDVSKESVPRISHIEMRPSIQMGVSGYKMRNRESSSSQNEEEVIYSLPVKKQHQKKVEKDETDERQCSSSSSPREVQKALRQSLPFSDIPEERTCDKIDEMFDFVEAPTEEDFTEKTLDRTVDGYTDVISRGSPAKRVVHRNNDTSANTYQDIEFEKDSTPFVEQFENDGTGFSGSSSGPHFTRSPTLITPHAGQSVTEYRVSEKEGRARTEKVVVQKMSQPAALATSTPKGTLAFRRNQSAGVEDSFVSSISNFSTADKINDSRRQISKLIETIEKTRKHIQLAEISLLDAKRARMVVQELASQRVLLICRERLKLQLDEVRRLQALSVVRHPPPPINRHFKSAMVISNIAVHLNKNFNCRGSFAFIVALKCRTEIEATGVVTLLAHYQTRMHVIHFAEHMHFSNLPVDFVISMEVYMMRVPEYKAPEKTCASLLASKVRNFLVPNTAHRRSKVNSITANRTVMSLPDYQPPECEFKFCGKLTLDRDSAGDRQYYLDDVTYPLEGTVKLVSHCSSLPEAIDVEYRGFLYLFDEKSPNGESAWERYWAMLHRGIIFFWKNPLDERNEQVPLSQIDLTKCTNQSIEETRNERSHEFQIELLIDQTPSLLEKRRVVLAAESADHLASWLNAINDTLCVLRS